MNIALVHMRHRAIGGTERFLDQCATHLASEGHEVTIVCRTHEAAPHPNVRFEVLRSLAFGPAHRMWSFAVDVERYVAESAHDLVFGLGRTWSQDVLRLGGGLMETYLERVGTDADAGGPFSRLPWRKQDLAVRVERRALAASPPPVLIVNSGFVRDDVLQRYPAWTEREERIHVIHNAADTDRFDRTRWQDEAAALRHEFGFEPGDFVFLYLGTGYRRKGLDVLLRAFAMFAGSHPGARLAVVGRDSNPGEFRALTADLGVADRVHFAGGRRDAEVCYAAADVYVLPTRYDPFANSTVEALASGLPVITTTTNGGSERVDDGVTGSIVGPDDVDALAARLDAWSDRTAVEAARPLARAEAVRFDDGAAMRTVTELLENTAAREYAGRPVGTG